MKLTKVLVGLLAISLCGVAAAAVKKGMSGAELRAGFMKAIKSSPVKEVEAKEFVAALKARGDWGYYRTMIADELREMSGGVKLIKTYLGKAPVTKKIDSTEEEKKKDLEKKEDIGVWDKSWGEVEPNWEDGDAVSKWSDTDSDVKAELQYGLDKMTAAKNTAAYEGFIAQAKAKILTLKK